METDALSRTLSSHKPLTIAVLATGGQGGGVLTDWIVAAAESQGWAAQSTSVPGVAQRTGSTIYYIELMRALGTALPVFALMPTPGDVDIVIAAELMEAGRAISRGFVNPSRTTLITSSHRSLAVVEKIVPGDGIRDPQAVMDAADIAAKRIIAFDMNELAERYGTVISAALLGAVAAAQVLPFERVAFEGAISKGGKGVETSLKAFAAAYERAQRLPRDPVARTSHKAIPELPEKARHPQLNRLLERIARGFPDELRPIVFAGVRRLVDYQDVRYAEEYLDRLEQLHRLDVRADGSRWRFAFSSQAAKYLAVAMAYDDVIRVADLKTRGTRFERLRGEVGATGDQLLQITEYMHPRLEEVLGTLPEAIGLFIERRPRLRAALDRRINRGRRVRTDTIASFLTLFLLGNSKFLRRRSRRHREEHVHREKWLTVASELVDHAYDVATEVIACRRLIKGYSDTHSRGVSKFDRILAVAPKLARREDGPDILRRLRQMALEDEAALSLNLALQDLEHA
jgi:indolepyruvate ferredoxin oxidoreductase beta subunit